MNRKQMLDLAFSAPATYSERSGMRVTSHAKPAPVLADVVLLSQGADEIRGANREREKRRTGRSIAEQVRWSIEYFTSGDLAMSSVAVY